MNNKLLLSASLAAFIGIIMAIHICDKEKRKQVEYMDYSVPVWADTGGAVVLIRVKPKIVIDSLVAFDSLGIKIVGYNIE